MAKKVVNKTKAKQSKAESASLTEAVVNKAKPAAKGGKKSAVDKKANNAKGRKANSHKDAEDPANERPPAPTGLIGQCLAVFGSGNLYDVLQVESSADGQQIKKAYYKVALRYHPDKHPNSDQTEALKEKFQLVGRVYSILSDGDRRKTYDQTGSVGDEDASLLIDDWLQMFARVTTQDVDNYLRVYCGSEEERNELIKLYDEHKGNWDLISEHLVSHSLDEEDRLKKIIADAIASGEVRDHGNEPAKKQKARRNRLLKEKKEVEAQAVSSDQALCTLIQNKQKARARKLNEDLDRIVQEEQSKAPAKKRRRRPE